eukprot:CAMPEP_0205904280 /NCGR_PEP_ID=MMETSP1325-20131115/626_1 /ASSEMBLY_ACC=CAM_ASM_000708 /TAXON_ID=236786 /ORGANISM="Florenciella sp., Strain RCC1007" /LENGTH=84 /DNA_ID=CAMNT_0053270035 /DNA_START=240 /DNA_END=491 /DNA_ORIENTATION=-
MTFLFFPGTFDSVTTSCPNTNSSVVFCTRVRFAMVQPVALVVIVWSVSVSFSAFVHASIAISDSPMSRRYGTMLSDLVLSRIQE